MKGNVEKGHAGMKCMTSCLLGQDQALRKGGQGQRLRFVQRRMSRTYYLLSSKNFYSPSFRPSMKKLEAWKSSEKVALDSQRQGTKTSRSSSTRALNSFILQRSRHPQVGRPKHFTGSKKHPIPPCLCRWSCRACLQIFNLARPNLKSRSTWANWSKRSRKTGPISSISSLDRTEALAFPTGKKL